ncbi:MAG TPA: hypothetical protein VGH50_10880 [Candidatus Binatia bacterium]
MRSTIKRLLVVVGIVLTAGCALIRDQQADQDNSILSLVLRHSYNDGGFTVVKAETKLSDYLSREKTKKYLLQKIRIEGYNIEPLVDLLFQRNERSARLSLKSSPEEGFIVDYEGKYNKYFAQGRGGWDKWYEENPKAHGSTEVSLPAYDPSTRIVLVYIGTQSHWVAGAGYVKAFRYEKDRLEPLGMAMLWVS